MKVRILRRMAPLLLLTPLVTHGAAPESQPLPELETFVVTGEQPGPALWKVTRKDHTLWILPTYGPLPAQLVWKSAQVEDVIRNSQEVYALEKIPVEPRDDVRLRGRALRSRDTTGRSNLQLARHLDLLDHHLRARSAFLPLHLLRKGRSGGFTTG